MRVEVYAAKAPSASFTVGLNAGDIGGFTVIYIAGAEIRENDGPAAAKGALRVIYSGASVELV
jgi:hypothetical protein